MTEEQRKKRNQQASNYRLKAYLKNLELAKRYYGFPFKCHCCDYTNEVFAPFDMHHVNPEEKEHTPSKVFKTATGAFEKEMKKCVLLCANCHRLHHHGSLEMKKRDEKIEVSFEARLTDRQINNIKDVYVNTDLSREQIADLVSISASTVIKYTKETKAKSHRGKYTGRPSTNRKLDCETVKKIKRETMKNRTNKSIALAFGIGEHTVGNIKNGVAYEDCL